MQLLLGLNAVANYKQTCKLVAEPIEANEQVLRDFFEVRGSDKDCLPSNSVHTATCVL